jgi:hypothetical protein
MVFREGDDYRQLRRPGDDPAQFRSVVRPAQLPPVPDSLIHEYRAQNFTTSTWPDSEQASDISVNGLSNSTLNGEPSVSGDGVDDVGLDGTLGNFGSSMDSDFAIEFVLQTTDTGRCIGVDNSTNSMALDIATDTGFDGTAGRLTFGIRSSQNGNNISSVESTVTVDDGTARHIICNKTSNSASGLEVIVNAANQTTSPLRTSFNSANTVDFNEEVAYFAVNNAGKPAAFVDAEIPFIRWYENSLTPTQQQDLLERQRYV